MENELNPPKPKAQRRRRASKPTEKSQFSKPAKEEQLEAVISEEVVSEEPAKAAESPAPVVEVTETPITNPPPMPTPEPEPAPWKRPVRPMKQRKASGVQRGVRKSKR